MPGLTAELRETLAEDLTGLLAKNGGQSKWELLASLESMGWQDISTTDVNSVLYQPHRAFEHDEGTPPLWWCDASPHDDSTSIDVAELTASILEALGSIPSADSLERDDPASSAVAALRMGLRLYKGPAPRAWQLEAFSAWQAAGRRGVIEAVTGTGKTAVGILAAAEAVAGGWHVLVVVPGRDLLDQWYQKLITELPSVRVGRCGDGASDALGDYGVLVATVQSASRYQMMPPGGHGLLIADEVHRYGTERYSLALEPQFAERLGLTATYERDDRGLELHLAPYFANDEWARVGGEIVARCGYERGLADGILARFRVGMVGVDFTSAERSDYDEWDAQAKTLMGQLINQHGCPCEPFGEYMKAVSELGEGGNDDSRATGRARQYLNAFTKRKALLADCGRKLDAFDALSAVLGSAERAIVFTETKDSANRAAGKLLDLGVSAQSYTSDLRQDERKRLMRTFRSGAVRVLCAPRVLDEGVDVPEADVGVIVASSRSRRQMIQRMGRIIRPNLDGHPASFLILYVRGTTEDPSLGAHEAFLEEMTDVAEEVCTFPSSVSGPQLYEWYAAGKCQ